MSLNTRCPACKTIFKVAAEQLKVSSGWVRCGRCAEVFDARSHFITHTATVTALPKQVDHAFVQKSSAKLVTSTAGLAIEPQLPASVPAPINTIRKPETAKQESPNVPELELSFVRDAQKKAFWNQRYVFALLSLSAFALLVALAMQIVYFQRDGLAVKYPALRPTLVRYCELLNCAISPLKQIESLKLESSSYQKMQTSAGDTYALKVTLKNNADWPVATPALELSLTDANDKPVIRRVLQAKDLGYLSDTLPANGEWSAETHIALAHDGSSSYTSAITGYRVLVFYP